AVMAVRRFDQLLGRGDLGVDQVVGQKHHERFIADYGGGAQYRVAQAQRGGLSRIDAIYIGRKNIAHDLQQLVLVLGGQFGFQFRYVVEMVFDGALVASRDEDQVGDAGGNGLFDGILDQGFIDDRQHFLGHGLGGGQEARA